MDLSIVTQYQWLKRRFRMSMKRVRHAGKHRAVTVRVFSQPDFDWMSSSLTAHIESLDFIDTVK
jgi:hypothetical protein